MKYNFARYIPPPMHALASLFSEAGFCLYAVGGLPRNGVLGLPPSDLDICSAMLPEAVLEFCRAHALRCIPKALELGTVEIHMDGCHFEHTTFRGDAYGAGGTHRPSGVTLGASLEEDAFRRDFTCNALYLNILRGELLDPTGGIADIDARIIRATSPAPATILQDDGLRMLRLVRFACELGFSIEARTWAAACAHVQGLADIAWERKQDELSKILLSDTRYPALTGARPSPVLSGLQLLYELGAWQYVLPALLEGDGIPQRPQFHAYNVLQHNLHACAAAAPTLTLRLAGLLHDVGKPAALREKGLDFRAGGHCEKPAGMKGTPMLNHDTLGVPIAKDALEQLRYPKTLVEEVLFLVAHHMYDLSFRAKPATLRAYFAETGYERALLLCDIREADVRGSGYCPDFVATPWRSLLAQMKAEGAPFSLEELACTGRDIMEWLELPPGEAVGIIKQRMLRHCARRPQDNTKERLHRLAKGMFHDISGKFA